MNARRFRSHTTTALVAAIAALLLAASQLRAADDDEEKLNKLNAKLMEQYQAGKFKDALETGKEMLSIAPNDGRTLYNMGCLSCKVGDNAKALEYLDRAAQNGFNDAAQAEKDDDLANIRNDPRFRQIIAHMRGESSTNSPTQSDDDEDDDAKRPQTPPGGAESDRDREVALLTEQVISESQQGNYKKALDLAEQALKLAPKAPITNYNVACMNARLKNTDEALDYLEKSVKLGMRDAKQINGDADLDNIRNTPRFKRIMASMNGTPTPPPVTPPPVTPPPHITPPPQITPPPPRQPAGEPEELTPDQPPRPRPQRPMPPIQQPPAPPVTRMPVASNVGEWHVTLPGDYDRDDEAPVVIALHPSGANMRWATERWEEACDRCNAILLTPQGNLGNGTDKYEWSQNLSECAASIHAACEAAAREFKFDRRAIVIVGAADSANLALQLAVDYPEMFCGVIAISPRLGNIRPASMGKHSLDSLRVYFAVNDDSPEEAEAKRVAKALKKSGAKTDVADFDDVESMPKKKRLKEQEKSLKWVLKDAHKRAQRRHAEDDDE